MNPYDIFINCGTSPLILIILAINEKYRTRYLIDESSITKANYLSFILIGWGLDSLLGINSLLVQTMVYHPKMAVICQIYVILAFKRAYYNVFFTLECHIKCPNYDINEFLEDNYE